MARHGEKKKLEVDVAILFGELTDIDSEHPLGSGSYGVVYKARHAGWGCYVAYKELRINHFIPGSVNAKEQNT